MPEVDAAVERLRRWNRDYNRSLQTPNWDITAVLDALADRTIERDAARNAARREQARAEAAEADVRHLRGVHDRMRIELDAAAAKLPRVTDEMVERAARAMFDVEPREQTAWDGATSIRRPWAQTKHIYRERARAALVAALEGPR